MPQKSLVELSWNENLGAYNKGRPHPYSQILDYGGSGKSTRLTYSITIVQATYTTNT
jgi:hypothetical protein